MGTIVEKLKNFWLGSEDAYDDGFDQLFKLTNSNQMTTNGINNNERKSLGNVDFPSSSQKNNTPSLKVVDSSYSATNEVVVIEPTNFSEALDVIQYLKKGSSIVLNLAKLEPEHSQRLLDFVCGGIYALDGSQKRVGDGVFLLVPSSVNINSLSAKENSKVSQFWGSK